MKIALGDKYLIFRWGNFQQYGKGFQNGPFRCWNYWGKWFRVGWELKRWH